MGIEPIGWVVVVEWKEHSWTIGPFRDRVGASAIVMEAERLNEQMRYCGHVKAWIEPVYVGLNVVIEKMREEVELD